MNFQTGIINGGLIVASENAYDNVNSDRNNFVTYIGWILIKRRASFIESINFKYIFTAMYLKWKIYFKKCYVFYDNLF